MERISAARAMEWSIELEKGLRSKRPGQSVESILQLGPKLQGWSREPQPTMAVYNAFDLVPGEDRLFANAILLRLAYAFMSGDKGTRISVVKVFLSELRGRKKEKKSKQYKGILSKARVHNHMELLKRVKVVFDTGDAESRALALVLFGCWANFAKDSAHIRYLILSSLVSSDISEVKASLFAAGCFSELADDFSAVVLEMMFNMLTSSETSLTVKLAGARVFAKMGSSYSIANKAYKTGLKLVLDSSDEEFLIAMLVPLSKLASKSTFLLSEQVDLLFLYLSQDKTLRLQATALRCLHLIFVRGACQSCVSSHAIKTLLSAADDTNLPSALQCEALQILHKMLLVRLPSMHYDNLPEFAHLLTIVENSIQSATTSKTLMAFGILVDVSRKLHGRTEIYSPLDCSSLQVQIISMIIDQIILLIKPLMGCCQTNTRVFQEVRSLLNFLLILVGENPELGVLVLDQIRLVIEHLVDKHESVMAVRQVNLSLCGVPDCNGEESKAMVLKMLYNVCIFSVTCLENLYEVNAVTTQILDKVKLLVESVRWFSFFACYTQIIYSILLRSQSFWGCIVDQDREACNVEMHWENSICNHLVGYEAFTVECAKKMLGVGNNWPAYRVGTFAACHGTWITAAFIFEQLTNKVQSDLCSYWLKSLGQFSQSERKIQLLLISRQASSFKNCPQMEEISMGLENFGDIFGKIGAEIGHGFIENITEVLVGAYDGICSSRETLLSIITSNKSCYFQRWLLASRARLLGAVVDVLKLMGIFPLKEKDVRSNEQVKENTRPNILNSLQQLIQISFQLLKLTEEIDLVALSFIGMDSRSSKIITALAFSCSVLAFSTGFALSISNVPGNELLRANGVEISKDYLKAMLIRSLVARLCLIDQEACSNLWLLLEHGKRPGDCFHLQPRKQVLDLGGEVRDALDVCNYAISGIAGLQKEAKGMQNGENLSQVTEDGLQLLLNIIMKWLHIPFRVPKFFFKVRPCAGSELFAFNADSGNPKELSIKPGFHLSLNLCVQLKNMAPDYVNRVSKLYCVLCSSVSLKEPRPSRENVGQVRLSHGARETDDMVQMNKKLFQFVAECTKEDDIKHGRERNGDEDDVVHTFVCFEMYGNGQGFASCLLDVSHFPLGCYRIKWHSCCVDRRGSYWSLLPLNDDPVFTVQQSLVVG